MVAGSITSKYWTFDLCIKHAGLYNLIIIVITTLIWLRYIDNVFFIWTHGEEKLKSFLEDLNKFEPYLKFTHEFSKESLPFLDLKVKLLEGKIKTDL